MTRDQARQEIKIRYADYLKPAKKRGTFICPLCQNGTGSTGDGLTVRDRTQLHCFKCGFDGDLIDIYMKETGADFIRAMDDLAARFNISIDQVATGGHRRDGSGSRGNSSRPRQETAQRPQEGRERPDYTAYYQDAHKALLTSQEALSYLHGRGLNDETIEHFNLGFVQSWKNPAGTFGDGTARIIVPLWKHGYLARSIKSMPQGEKIHAGVKRPFNLDALTPSAGTAGEWPPLVVEGAFDAMTLWQWGYNTAVALNGTGTTEFIEAAQKMAPDVVYILALDNDKAGIENQQRAATAMEAAGLACVGVDQGAVYGDVKDAGEAGQKGLAERVCTQLVPYIQTACERREAADRTRAQERYLQTGAGMVDTFLQEITGERYKPIQTGIQAIDYATGGGFMRQTLILLGAEPGAGKTALASMIFENMAKYGTMTLYFNLEMSRNQLIARSLARIAYQTTGKKITGVEVLQGYRHTDEVRSIVNTAASAYKEDIADGILYNPGNTGANLDAITAYIEEEARRQEANGNGAPIVCLDYLQLLTGADREDDTAVLKRAVATLKGYATRHNSIVFAIMAQSRAANKSREASISAGRDTSALEYSADLQLQLVREDEEAPDEVTLYVTKNRFGVADTRKGKGTVFHFMGGQSLFVPIDNRHSDPLAGSPVRRL